jgi:hypothetical protein
MPPRRQARHRKPEHEIVRRHAHVSSDQLNEEVAFATPEHGRSVVIFDENNDPQTTGFRWVDTSICTTLRAARRCSRNSPASVSTRCSIGGGHPRRPKKRYGAYKRYEEVERTHERGYSFNNQEVLERLMAVGIAITTPDGSVLGSLDVSGPPYRLFEERIVSELRETGSAIEREIASRYGTE